MSFVAVLVPVGALFVMVALLSARVVSVLVRLWPIDRALFRRATAWPAAILAAPTLMATLVCIAVISAAALDGCHCAQHTLHHPHLCLAHPIFAQPLLQAASWFLGAWALWVVPRVFALVRAVIASHRWMRNVRLIAPRLVDGVAVRVVDCPERSAFTIGALSPLVVFDRELWTALSEEQRLAVIHHEAAHISRRDGLTLLALRCCAALFPLATADRLIDSWSAAAEMCCDQYAGAKLGDVAAVAEALVAVERARALTPLTETRTLVTAMAALSSGSIEPRVMALLDTDTQRESRSALANDVLALALFAMAAAVVLSMSLGDSIHHGVETLIGLFSHLL